MHHLLFVEQDYAFSILSPIAAAAQARGDQVTWYVLPGKDCASLTGQKVIHSLDDARAVPSDTVIAPGNWVPAGLNGIAVQVFHGFGIEKKGHFRIRGFFDLYCTPGPVPTQWFSEQAVRERTFKVVETGWPKLDPWAATAQSIRTPGQNLSLLFAPTFSPKLTAAPELLPYFNDLLDTTGHHLTIRFHPLMDQEVIDAYQPLAAKGAQFDQTGTVLEAISNCDVVVSDTSSVVHEAIWHNRPVLTFRNAAPGPHLIDVTSLEDMNDALQKLVDDYAAIAASCRRYASEIHPYWDGQSSSRVLHAIDSFLKDPAPRERRVSAYRRWRVGKKVKRLEQDLAV